MKLDEALAERKPKSRALSLARGVVADLPERFE
jgi:hypothetical protein